MMTKIRFASYMAPGYALGPLGVLLLALSLALFWLHFPGQASVDTLLQLSDGGSRIYVSNQPPSMSLLLATLSQPGMLSLDIALFALACACLARHSPNGSRKIYWVVSALYLFPICLLYLGTIWKDVLFAHCTLLALLLLPTNKPVRWPTLVAAAICMALGVSIRQQGALLILPFVGYLLLQPEAQAASWRLRLKRVSAWLMVCLLCVGAIKLAVHWTGDTSKSVSVEGPLRQLAMFDLGGIALRVPALEFPSIDSVAPSLPLPHRPTREHMAKQLALYTPERQDYMTEPDLSTNIWIPSANLYADWRAAAASHPLAYLQHRTDFLGWLFGFHEPAKCTPFALGWPGQDQLNARQAALNDLGRATVALFRPCIYLLTSVAVLLLLIRWNWRVHAQMIALQVSGLVYAASYAVVGFACDVRYTYYSIVAALFGVAYIAIKAPWRKPI